MYVCIPLQNFKENWVNNENNFNKPIIKTNTINVHKQKLAIVNVCMRIKQNAAVRLTDSIK